MRNSRINLSNLFTIEPSAYLVDNPFKLESEPEFNGVRSCMKAMNMFIARNRLNPELAKLNYGETPRAAVRWSLGQEELTVTAFSLAFGFRGVESNNASISDFTTPSATTTPPASCPGTVRTTPSGSRTCADDENDGISHQVNGRAR